MTSGHPVFRGNPTIYRRSPQIILTSDNVDVEDDDMKRSNGCATAKVLRWGMEEDYSDGPFDVVIAGDVVTSLYDPSALAKTIYDLCHEKTVVYICVKRRLSTVHTKFEGIMAELFDSVSFAFPITRHRNIERISIMRAVGKKSKLS